MRGSTMVVKISGVNDLGSVIRKQRKSKGVTQVKASQEAGVGHRFYGELENGKPTVRFESVLRVLGSLGLELQVVVPDLERDQVELEG